MTLDFSILTQTYLFGPILIIVTIISAVMGGIILRKGSFDNRTALFILFIMGFIGITIVENILQTPRIEIPFVVSLQMVPIGIYVCVITAIPLLYFSEFKYNLKHKRNIKRGKH